MANKPFNIEHLQMGATFSFVGEKEVYVLEEIDSIEVKGKAKLEVKISQIKVFGRSKKVIIKK